MKHEDTIPSARSAGSPKKLWYRATLPVACLVVVAAGLIAYRTLPHIAEDVPSLGASAPNLAHHAIYSQYEFGTQKNVIDIGIQPL